MRFSTVFDGTFVEAERPPKQGAFGEEFGRRIRFGAFLTIFLKSYFRVVQLPLIFSCSTLKDSVRREVGDSQLQNIYERTNHFV